MIGTLRTPEKKSPRQARPAPAAALARTRAPLLSAQLHAEVSLLGALAVQQNNLHTAGACLNEAVSFSDAPNGLSGLAADLSKLFESFEALSANPANLPLRRSAVRNAQEVATQFNRAYSRLEVVKCDLNSAIQKDVIKANDDLSDIAALNGQIMRSKAAGRKSSPLTGQREQYLEALASRVNIIVARPSHGGVNVAVSGVTMVCGGGVPDNLATYPDKYCNLRLQAQETGARLKVDGGSIGGRIAARDGTLAELQSGLNTLASHLIDRVNSIYNSGCDLNGGMDRNFFTGTSAVDIGVNSAIAGEPSRMRLEGAAPALAKLGRRNFSGLGNRTFTQCYAQAVSKLGHTLSRVNENLSRTQAVTQMLANKRVATHGVSLDEEVISLTQYQQACAGSERMIAALEQLLPMK